jgi:RimJ/RimL family protein N-acetyltransferase
MVSSYREEILAHPDAIEIPLAVIGDGCARVAVVAGRIVGFSIVLPRADGLAELDGLFVKPELMGRGVGHALMEDAFSIARDQGVQRIEVTSNPRAVGFYERIGFVADGLAPTRFGPALRMHLELGINQSAALRVRAPRAALETERLRLLPNHVLHSEALRLSGAAFTERFGLAVAAGLTDFLQPASRDTAVAMEWDSFLIVLRADPTLIGFCACRKFPDAAGAVEIAYSIAPDFQGRGLATEAARAMTESSLGRTDLTTVCAHTMPEKNASTCVLAKCGFQMAGEIIHPEDGRVWRWEKMARARIAAVEE